MMSRNILCILTPSSRAGPLCHAFLVIMLTYSQKYEVVTSFMDVPLEEFDPKKKQIRRLLFKTFFLSQLMTGNANQFSLGRAKSMLQQLRTDH